MSAELLLVVSQLLSASIRAGIGAVELRNKIVEVRGRGGDISEVSDWIRTKAHENLARLDQELREAGW